MDITSVNYVIACQKMQQFTVLSPVEITFCPTLCAFFNQLVTFLRQTVNKLFQLLHFMAKFLICRLELAMVTNPT
jgi:hypothetical protein